MRPCASHHTSHGSAEAHHSSRPRRAPEASPAKSRVREVTVAKGAPESVVRTCLRRGLPLPTRDPRRFAVLVAGTLEQSRMRTNARSPQHASPGRRDAAEQRQRAEVRLARGPCRWTRNGGSHLFFASVAAASARRARRRQRRRVARYRRGNVGPQVPRPRPRLACPQRANDLVRKNQHAAEDAKLEECLPKAANFTDVGGQLHRRRRRGSGRERRRSAMRRRRGVPVDERASELDKGSRPSRHQEMVARCVRSACVAKCSGTIRSKPRHSRDSSDTSGCAGKSHAPG